MPDKSKSKKEEKTKSKEAEEESESEKIEKATRILMFIQGVGPKTAEKLVESGFETLDTIIESDPAAIASAIPGLSVSKSEDVISAAVVLKEDIASGKVDVSGKKKKRKKKEEPPPDKHDLPPAQEIEMPEVRTSLETGLDVDNEKLGVFAGPKWLTKFERARIVGARALQISMGAPILVDKKKAPKSLFTLAELELSEGKLPMTVRRTLPTGEYFDISLAILLKHTRLE